MLSIEQELAKISTAQNEQTLGLESVADQMAALDAIPYKEQMEQLVKSVKNNLADDKSELQRMLALYIAEDLNGLLKFMRESENSVNSQYENELLVKRNVDWIPKISAAVKTPTFFAVGAAHLPGESGVINLLRKQGFKVEAVLNQ